jgi:hypothetical protein
VDLEPDLDSGSESRRKKWQKKVNEEIYLLKHLMYALKGWRLFL